MELEEQAAQAATSRTTQQVRQGMRAEVPIPLFHGIFAGSWLVPQHACSCQVRGYPTLLALITAVRTSAAPSLVGSQLAL